MTTELGRPPIDVSELNSIVRITQGALSITYLVMTGWNIMPERDCGQAGACLLQLPYS